MWWHTGGFSFVDHLYTPAKDSSDNYLILCAVLCGDCSVEHEFVLPVKIVSTSLSFSPFRGEGGPLTFGILVGEQSDRIVDCDSLLGKAGMEALNQLTFYTE